MSQEKAQLIAPLGHFTVPGLNVKGLLGQNNTTYYSSPVQIPGTDWVMSGTAISAGDVAMSALKN